MKKKAIILGFGISGRAAYELADYVGFACRVYDDSFEEAVKRDVLSEVYELCIVSPGFPSEGSVIKAVKKNNPSIDIVGEIEFAERYFDGDIVAITGTNGKTTAVSLLSHIMKDRGCIAAGNIGAPFSRVVLNYLRDKKGSESLTACGEDKKRPLVVLELSSFQLADMKKARLQAAAVLNITEDHLDVHRSLSEYIAVKNSVYSLLCEKGTAVINKDDLNVECTFSGERITFSSSGNADCVVRDGIILFNGKEIMPASEIKLMGRHNLSNVLAVVCIAVKCGASEREIRRGISSFYGLKHRLEYVGKVNGTLFYNDSKATNPDSTIKAVKCFDDKRTVVILGGSDKAADFSELFGCIKGIFGIVFIGKTTIKMAKCAEAVFDEEYCEKKPVMLFAENMRSAVEKAFSLKPEVVLLSPACASFDRYGSYEERGNDFIECVRELALSLGEANI